jgi:D-sedoheptulose 7-phosphate isomerase
MSHTQQYLYETMVVANKINPVEVDEFIAILHKLKTVGGRLFILGVGGSAANASHAVNDFRKICNIQAYAPTDNVAELTAQTNDVGWETIFKQWLAGSRLSERDCVMVLSVGGGNLEKNVSPNLVLAVQYANEMGASVIGIVGRDGGFTRQHADATVLIPIVNDAHITPHTEGYQVVIFHLMVNHPLLK